MTHNIQLKAERIEIQVMEPDAGNSVLLGRSDIVFAILYGALFIWGVGFTLASI